jgi:hypothetical protein
MSGMLSQHEKTRHAGGFLRYSQLPSDVLECPDYLAGYVHILAAEPHSPTGDFAVCVNGA